MANKKPEQKKEETKKLIKVKFIASPAAQFFLAHRPGQTASFTDEQVKELVKAGVAEKI